jgi:hypothetical protein
MALIGIDPALRATGIAIIDSAVRLYTFRWKGSVQDYVAAVYSWSMEHELVATDLKIEWPPKVVHGRTSETRLLAFCSGVWATSIPAKRTRVLEPRQWYRALWGHENGTDTMAWAEARQCCQKYGHPGPADEHQAEALCLALTPFDEVREGGDDER